MTTVAAIPAVTPAWASAISLVAEMMDAAVSSSYYCFSAAVAATPSSKFIGILPPEAVDYS